MNLLSDLFKNIKLANAQTNYIATYLGFLLTPARKLY